MHSGSRTFYRILLRILKPTLTVWDDAAPGFWDTAVKESSALKAHLARALELEVGAIEGKKSLLFLWDLRKFYHRIRLSKLLTENLTWVVPRSVCYQCVDDMSQVLTEDDPHEMVKEGLAIGRTVKEGIDRLDLRLADKSVILPAGDPVVDTQKKRVNQTRKRAKWRPHKE